MKNYFEQLKQIYEEYVNFDKDKIPLCAAENYVPNYVRNGLSSRYEGKYISGYIGRDVDKDFIGSDYIEKLLNFANTLGSDIFGAKYCDFRCLTGMNTVALMLMILAKNSRKILITDPFSGGHGSLPKLCINFGVKYESIPYNMDCMQINYDALNDILAKDKDISLLFFCQSDLIQPPDLSKIKIPETVSVVYDATQTMGLIAGKKLANPLSNSNNIILIGGTHKTFPSVTCGFVATNNDELIKKIDTNISPNFLRNIQANNILSVCLSMLEMLEIGEAYAENIVRIANELGYKLEDRGMSIKAISDKLYTQTHQIYIKIKQEQVDESYINFKKYGVTLNKRKTPYITGFRLGVQEIARYKMCDYLDELADLLSMILYSPHKEKEIFGLKGKLSGLKTDIYYLDKLFMEWD